MLDRIPERLRTAAEGVAKATQAMADAKSRRNRAAGDVGACYSGLDKELTAEWQAADELELLRGLVAELHDSMQSEAGNMYLECDLGERVAAYLKLPKSCLSG